VSRMISARIAAQQAALTPGAVDGVLRSACAATAAMRSARSAAAQRAGSQHACAAV